MKDNTKPLLTIGIIFMNEIRSLRHCLEALNPLREAICCELIMADTGSSDGSREIAAQYADILFDFPWVGDFSAARNAVMDRASGQWYLTVDTDEYLDKDVSELVHFLQSCKKSQELACGVVQRNYDTMEMDSKYSDFLAVRLICMSTGLRYQGAIHEAWPLEEKGIQDVRALSRTILHHDGYVDMDGEGGREKRERNLTLLRKNLQQNPEDLKLLLQYIESGRRESNYLEMLRHAATAVEGKNPGWQLFGPPLFRHAVKAALEEDLPEFWNWTTRAEKWFPDSYYTRIDIEYIAFTQSLKEGKYSSAIQRGERCLRAIKEFRKNEESLAATLFSTILMSSPYWEQGLEIYLADLYIKNGSSARARELLLDIDSTLLDVQQTGNLLCVLGDLHRLSNLDTAPMIQELYEGIRKPIPSEETAHKREEMFYQTAALAFHSQNRKEEQLEPNFCRPSYMMFIPLLNQCDIGRGAAVLALTNPEEMQLVLEKVEDWEQFPGEVLSHAIEQGVSFPLPEKPLMSEDINRLADRLAADEESFYRMIRCIFKENCEENLQKLAWINQLVLTAVQRYNWDTANNDIDTGIELARFFAQTEECLISRYYRPEMLDEENYLILPALHRFGWHCARAFNALDAGSPDKYVRELRKGLHTCGIMKPMVEWLMKHTPALKRNEVSPELLALAEQVKTLLASYPSENVMVQEIKSSPVYQKVAWLIEV